ncbi:MAG: glycosyltransferase family 4 protein [Nitrospirales bacterium]|nr:glycosyltransferase family 4 protein [Nitrospirales bacterium]
MLLEYPKVVFSIATLIALVVANRLYFKIALHAGIVDIPNQRSSHLSPTIRGGGIVFVVAFLFWSFLNIQLYPWFIAAVLLIAIVSFIDDVRSLPASVRFFVHLVSMILVGIQVELFNQPLWILFPVIIVGIGAINSFNFMDGINGITGMYGLVNLLTFFFINHEIIHFMDDSLTLYVLMSILVFLFYNFRKQALCFAGDVGSVTLAFIQVFLLVKLIFVTYQFAWIFMFLVFGVDSVVTILYRLKKGENIFKPHRSHLYQYLSNEMGQSHLIISSVYGLLQLAINAMLIILLPNASVGFVVLMAAFIFVLYVVAREQALSRLGMKGFLGDLKLSL